jgi:hypothetical protein
VSRINNLADNGPFDEEGKPIIRGRDVKFILDRLCYLDEKIPIVRDANHMKEEQTVWFRVSKAINYLKSENKALSEQIEKLKQELRVHADR